MRRLISVLAAVVLAASTLLLVRAVPSANADFLCLDHPVYQVGGSTIVVATGIANSQRSHVSGASIAVIVPDDVPASIVPDPPGTQHFWPTTSRFFHYDDIAQVPGFLGVTNIDGFAALRGRGEGHVQQVYIVAVLHGDSSSLTTYLKVNDTLTAGTMNHAMAQSVALKRDNGSHANGAHSDRSDD